MRLVDADGTDLGVVPIDQALIKAEDRGLDLVEVAAKGDPPVCKILDYGKFKYEAQKKKNEARKKQKTIDVKEIKIILAKQNADEKMKSNFKRFKNEMEKTRGIECQMRVMNKEISDEIHDRYIICPNKSYNIVSGDTARRGQVGDVSECARPDIERWWDDSYDIFQDWNKFQDDN